MPATEMVVEFMERENYGQPGAKSLGYPGGK